MIPVRQILGGLGNLMFKHAFLYAMMRRGQIPDVYVQDFGYFGDFKEEVRAMYQQGVYSHDPRIALHIRRGDYNDNSFYVDLTKTDYYDKAIDMFRNEKFLVFCADRQAISNDEGDREWCRKWLLAKGIDFEFWNGKDEIDDMNMMASCRGHIMANSTFSTWAAFINPNPAKIVIAPKQYYSDGIERTVLPKDEGWTFIDCNPISEKAA